MLCEDTVYNVCLYLHTKDIIKLSKICHQIHEMNKRIIEIRKGIEAPELSNPELLEILYKQQKRKL